MRIKSIFLQNFRGFRSGTTVDVAEGINVVVGQNGWGKSSLLNSIEWCLFGRDVEKMESGLHERRAWEIEHRDGGGSATEVRLLLDTTDGDVVLTRSREPDAKRNAQDQFEVRLPSGQVLTQDHAEQWMGANRLPSWSEWKSCYCQHQEAARDRLIDKTNRSGSLAALLGLEEITQLRASLDGLKISSAKSKLIRMEDRIANDLELLLQAAGGLQDAKDELDRLEIGPETVTRDSALKAANALLDKAIALKKKLELSVDLPSAFDKLDGALAWAANWAKTVRSEPGRLAHLDDYRNRIHALDSHLGTIETLQARVEITENELNQSIASDGDLESRQRALQEAKKDVERVDAQRKAHNSLQSLLQDAVQVLNDEPSDICPVCELQRSGLAEHVADRLDSITSQDAKRLEEELNTARTEEKRASDRVKTLEVLQNDARSEKERARRQINELTQLLPESSTGDLVATAKSQRENLAGKIKEIEPLAGHRDHELDVHRDSMDCLKAKHKFLIALEKESKRADIRTLPGWGSYQEALTEMAGLLCDLEAIDSLARNRQKEMSDERLAAVNTSLGKYFSTITGQENAAARGLAVQVKLTPKKIDYNIVDGSGRELVPILNQAALNAISAAMLFAQAENAAAKGGPGLLVLDDPEQSLDEHHVSGLAKAIEEAAAHAIVLVAATPGRLSERISKMAAGPKQLIRLNEWDEAVGASINP